jgi:hypothetical protein
VGLLKCWVIISEYTQLTMFTNSVQCYSGLHKTRQKILETRSDAKTVDSKPMLLKVYSEEENDILQKISTDHSIFLNFRF